MFFVDFVRKALYYYSKFEQINNTRRFYMPATIKDVAREAGVSISTVSKVLNNWTTISDATKQKVNDAIHKLNYTPNARAVSFARQTTKNIVFLTSLQKDDAYRNPHMFDIMCGVNNELVKNGYTMTLIDTSIEQYPGEMVEKTIAAKQADGLIIHGSAITREVADSIINNQFPHIIIGHPGFESRLCWIDTNHASAGECAAEHLTSKGYTKIAFIGGKKTDYISSQREKGFVGYMYQLGYNISPALIGYTSSAKEESFRCALSIIENAHPEAIICENNMIALGVLGAIKSKNLLLPTDIALLTFDTYPYSTIMDPLPTVVDINVFDMGVQAGMMMMRKLENPTLLIQSYTTLPEIHQGITT